MNSRLKGRQERLLLQAEKLEDRIRRAEEGWIKSILPDSKEVRRWKEHLDEVIESLSNIGNHGWEVRPNGFPAGVNIGVPHVGVKT